MKTFFFNVNGNLTAQVKGKTETEALDKLEEWLSDNSPISNWECDSLEKDYVSVDNGGVPSTDIDVDKSFDNPDDEMKVSWHIDDIKSIRPEFTDEECREVLRIAKKNHDASIGINWDVLEIWASEFENQRDLIEYEFTPTNEG